MGGLGFRLVEAPGVHPRMGHRPADVCSELPACSMLTVRRVQCLRGGVVAPSVMSSYVSEDLCLEVEIREREGGVLLGRNRRCWDFVGFEEGEEDVCYAFTVVFMSIIFFGVGVYVGVGVDFGVGHPNSNNKEETGGDRGEKSFLLRGGVSGRRG